MSQKLLFHKLDIEARLGFRPGRFTSPNRLLAFLIGAALTVAFMGFLIMAAPALARYSWVSVFVERGLIPYFTMLAFFWGCALLWLKARKSATQRKALLKLTSEKFASYTFSAQNAPQWVQWLDGVADKPYHFILLNRLRVAFASLENVKEPAAVSDLMAHMAAMDEDQVESSYTFINMIIYAVPVLGFIGTVLGLGEAIGGFGGTLAAGTDDMGSLIESLQSVTGGLAVAFDTTLLALIAALVLQVYSSFIKTRELQFLEDCNSFLLNEFFPNLVRQSTDVQAVEVQA